MSKAALSLSLLVLAAQAARADVRSDEVKRLLVAGVPESVVLAYVRAGGPVLTLSVDDVLELKAARASERVFLALFAGCPIDAGTGTSAPAGETGAPCTSGSANYVDAILGSYDSPWPGYRMPTHRYLVPDKSLPAPPPCRGPGMLPWERFGDRCGRAWVRTLGGCGIPEERSGGGTFR